MRMDSRDRVMAAFMHEEPDRVPIFEQEIASNVASEILGRYAYTGGGGIGWRDVAEMVWHGRRDLLVQRLCQDLVELHVKLDLDIVRAPLVPERGATGPTRKIDEYTYYYEDREAGSWVVNRYCPRSKVFMAVDSSVRREGLAAIQRIIDVMELKPVEFDESIFEALDYVVKALGDEKFIAGHGGLAVPMDPQWLKAFIGKPSLIARYLDLQLERVMKLIELQKKHGVDFILGGGDLADSHGPAYSPKLFKSFVLPRLRKLTSFCHRLDLPYIYRTDGNTWPIARELFLESGVDGYGEIDAQAGMDLGELKERLPSLVLWGNVDCAKTLVYGSKEDVEAEAKRCIERGAPGGGYIFGSSNTIHPGVATENFITMLKAARSYGLYKY